MLRRNKTVRLLIIVILFISPVFLVGRIFAYDATITHLGLTKLAGELYNKDAKIKLTNQEIGWLARGAVEEDTPLRWMNHFYDPINNRGLAGAYDSAKVWSIDYNGQTGYARGNNTWQEAIYQYQKGDKEKAFIALGHILHLLEDMTVPAHTRDDAHPEGDPYEQWVRQNFHTVDAQMIYYNNLGEYFDYLSNFSNNNFYSKDTVENEKYKIITIKSKEGNEDAQGALKIYYFTQFNDFVYPIYFSKFENEWDKYYLSFTTEKFVSDPFIFKTHFSLLAPKAIGAGAGVIKLFFEETQKPQQYTRPFWQITLNGIIQQQTAGAVVPLAGKIKDRTTDAFKELADSGKQLIYDLANAGNLWDFFSDVWKTNTALARDFKDLSEMKGNLLAAPAKIASQAVETVKDSLDGQVFSAEKAYQILKNLDAAGSSSAISRSSVASTQSSSVTVEEPVPVPNLNDIFFLTEPTSAAVLPIVNLPTISSNIPVSSGGSNIYSFLGGGGSASSGNSSTQNQESSSLINSSSTLENASTDESGNTASSTVSSTSTFELIEPATSTSTPVASSTPESTFTESTSSTLEIPAATSTIETSTSTLDWPTATSPPDDPGATSTLEDIIDEDAEETEESEEPEEAVATAGLVVINEIAWGGTQAAGNDEWLELYNAENFKVDLSQWLLTDGNDLDFIFPTSTIIEAGEYLLMERTNDNTIASHQVDIIYTGSLRDGGEKLTLKNNAGEIVDEVNFPNRWPAGRNEYDKETMERKSSVVSGSDAGNWQNTPMAVWQGRDVKGNAVAGTPGSPNSSVIYLNGELANDRVLGNGTYLLGSLIIPASKTLKISAGAKIVGGLASNMQIYGKLEALGESDQPVVFTSYQDAGEFYLQDTNWGYIQVLSGGEANLENVQFNFGNSKFYAARPSGLIYTDNAVLNLDGVIFDKNLNEKPRGDWPLISANNSYLEIKNSQFLDSPKGLIAKGGSLSLAGNSFDGLGLSALETEDMMTVLMENNIFKNLGWAYMNREYWERPLPLLAPVSFKNFLPEKMKGNTFENNILNSWEVYGRLIVSGKIDTLGESPVIMNLLEIPAGLSLEAAAGSIVKIKPNSSIKVFGRLLSNGTENKPVIFTSLHDDENGGEVDLAENQEVQKEGNEWARIWIKSTEQSVLNNTLVRFANGSAGEYEEGSVFVDDSSLAAQNLTIEYSRVPGVALHLKNTDAIIDGCLMRNDSKRNFDITAYNDGSGIWINGGSPKISNCVIDTFNFGVRLNPESSPELSNMEYKNVDFETGL